MNPPNTAKQFRRQLGILILSFLVLAGVMYWIVADDWALTAVRTDTVSMGYLLPADGEVSQQISVAMDGLEAITVVPHFDAAERSGQVTFTLADEEGTVWTAERAASALLSDQANTIAIEPGLKHVNKLTLTIAPNGTGMALWAGNTVSAGKFDVAVMTSGLTVNGAAAEGMLVLNLTGHNILQGTRWFWPGAILLLTAIVCLVCATHMQRQKGKRTLLTVMVDVCQRYRYLLRQLVNRDFRVKYKSSALGMVWSLLNPLLTMLVYLFVFSTLFKSDVENFPVYLMSGIVLFSYFSEATNLGMASIVGKRNPLAQTRTWFMSYEQARSRGTPTNAFVGGRLAVSDCSQVTDGAVVVILASEAYMKSRGLTNCPIVKGYGHRVAPMLFDKKMQDAHGSEYILPWTRQTALDAYRRSGLTVDDIQVFETHDCFTSSEYAAISAFGITPPGKEYRAVENGTIAFSGSKPINPSGGLIGCGHPVGASGVRMFLDLYKQTAGCAGAYQVENARNGMMLNIGGSGTTNYVYIVGKLD